MAALPGLLAGADPRPLLHRRTTWAAGERRRADDPEDQDKAFIAKIYPYPARP